MSMRFTLIAPLMAALASSPSTALAQTLAPAPSAARPSVGPEKPFHPVAREERTLANGLRVIVARKATVPKVSVLLTVRSGLAADPGSLPGVAAESVTVIVKFDVPAGPSGVPEITPFDSSSSRPAGSEPALVLKVRAPVPPVTTTVCE